MCITQNSSSNTIPCDMFKSFRKKNLLFDSFSYLSSVPFETLGMDLIDLGHLIERFSLMSQGNHFPLFFSEYGIKCVLYFCRECQEIRKRMPRLVRCALIQTSFQENSSLTVHPCLFLSL